MPAPIVATALAAISSSLAKRGLDLLSGIFRGSLDKGTREIADLIEEKTGIDINDAAEGKLTEEQWNKLKEFEYQYQSKLLEYRQQADANALEEERIHQRDREDARDLQEAALASDSRLAKSFIYIYAYVITGLTFLFIAYAAFVHDYSNENKQQEQIINTVIGFLLGVSLSAIIQYFFGSSAGSRNKDQQITRLTNQAVGNTSGDDSNSQGAA